jgi:DNA processing protein
MRRCMWMHWLSPILLRFELQGVLERLPGSRYLLAVELRDT